MYAAGISLFFALLLFDIAVFIVHEKARKAATPTESIYWWKNYPHSLAQPIFWGSAAGSVNITAGLGCFPG